MGKYSYSNMATYLSQMTDEAINAAMSWVGFHGSLDSGFEGSPGGGSSGSDLRIGPGIGGGQYEGSTFVPGGQVTDIDGTPMNMSLADIYIGQGWPYTTVQGLVDYYTNGINNLFDPWWQIPTPGAFDSEMNAAMSAARNLAMDASVSADPTKSHLDTGPAKEIWGGNDALSSAADLADTRTAYFDGATAIAFQSGVTSRLGKVVAAQDAVATMLYVATKGENAIWDKTRDSLAEIAGQGVEAMKAAKRSGGGFSLEDFLLVVGAVALVAAPFTGGASVAAFGVTEATAKGIEGATNAVGVITQTSSAFVPETKEPSGETGSASNPVDALAKIGDALNQLKDAIRKEEQGIQHGCSALTSALTSQPSSFNLKTLPPKSHITRNIVSDTDAADYSKFVVDVQRVKDIADLLTDGIPGATTGVALELGRARNSLQDALGSGPWSRPGDIGLGAQGPYSEYAALVDKLWTYLNDTVTYLGDCAAVLRIVARDAHNVDQTNSDLTKRQETVENRKAATPPNAGVK